MRMRSRHIPSNEHDKWLFYGLIGLIIYLPLPLGSNRIWAWGFAEAWIFALSVSWILLSARNKVSPPEFWKKCWLPLYALVGFLLLTLFQLMPLNIFNATPIEIIDEIPWTQPSLDPHATLQAALKTFSYLCLFLLVLALVRTEKRIKLVLTALFLSGLFQAGYGSLMTLSGVEKIFFMDKVAYIGKATGTFINRNHFANYLIMCIAAGTALLLIDLSTRKAANFKESVLRLLRFILSTKMLLRISLALSVVGIVLSQSRMGNTAFFVSLMITGVLWMILTRRVTRNTILLLVSIIIIDVLIVGKWFGFEKVQQRLQSTSSQSEARDEVIRDTKLYIEEHWLVGSGGGSYYAVYPYYQGKDVKGFYQHAHNDYLQFMSEYGVIGTLLIGLLVLSSTYIALITMIKRRNKVMQAVSFASLMSIIALFIHSTVDFNLQIMANASTVIILLALAWIARYIKTERSRQQI